MTKRNRAAVLRHAAAVLRAGGVVAHPTDTVYGLAALASSPAAVRRVHTIKGSREDKPLLILLPTKAELSKLAKVSSLARRLVREFWPGPLALILAARAGGVVGVRYPAHALSRQLARLAGGPLTTTSANPTGQIAPQTAAEVMAYFARRRHQPDLVLDTGEKPNAKALPSTIVNFATGTPRLVRAGSLPYTTIRQWLARR